MTRGSSWLAAAIVVAANTGALGMAWMNRTGTPSALVELTEREARLLPRDSDNTSMALRLAWVEPPGSAGVERLLDPEHLASLGFDVTAPVTDENGPFYRGQAPRSAYAAFELEGEAWERYLASLATDADRDAALNGPHAVLVDVGPDAGALRARHPDRRRVFITQATVGLAFRSNAGRNPVLEGRLNQAYPIELTVPPHLRDRLASLPARAPRALDVRPDSRRNVLPWSPRYRLRVAWGSAFEPWLVAVE